MSSSDSAAANSIPARESIHSAASQASTRQTVSIMTAASRLRRAANST
jgi:hypothetical protein